MAILANNVDWHRVDPERAQLLIQDPVFAGTVFRDFLNRGRDQDQDAMIINFSLDPRCPAGYSWTKHQTNGSWRFDKSEVGICLTESQKKDGRVLAQDVAKELIKETLMNANLLDFYLDHTEHIPNDWKGRNVVFCGTVYKNGFGVLYFRYLYWDGEDWLDDFENVSSTYLSTDWWFAVRLRLAEARS
jgi:hypothetical protein